MCYTRVGCCSCHCHCHHHWWTRPCWVAPAITVTAAPPRIEVKPFGHLEIKAEKVTVESNSKPRLAKSKSNRW